MALTPEQNKMLIETATIVKRLDKTLFSEEGAPRCAKNMEKIDTLEKSTARTKQYAWGVALVFITQLVYSIFK